MSDGSYQEDLEQIHGAPIGWFPVSERNPSKLTAHKFVNGEWIRLCYSKIVAWPEAFPKADPHG